MRSSNKHLFGMLSNRQLSEVAQSHALSSDDVEHNQFLPGEISRRIWLTLLRDADAGVTYRDFSASLVCWALIQIRRLPRKLHALESRLVTALCASVEKFD